MTELTWTDAFAMNEPAMDATHQEFVAHLAACRNALDGQPQDLLQRFESLVAHTAEHFAQENRWMATIGLAPLNCHAQQHESVLDVMRQCAEHARRQGDDAPLRAAVAELGPWFAQHALAMDAGLAHVMAAVGYDTATDTMARPPDAVPDPGERPPEACAH